MMAEPYVPIAEYAAPLATQTGITTVINANLTKPTNVLDDKNAALASEAITEELDDNLFHPLMLGGG